MSHVMLVGWSVSSSAQMRSMTARYERAAAIQAANADRWFLNSRLYPYWIDNVRFWFDRETPDGHRYTLVNLNTRDAVDAFDHEALARNLGALVDDSINVDANDLRLQNVRIRGNPLTVTFSGYGGAWTYEAGSNRVLKSEGDHGGRLLISPNGRKGIFLKDNNLWIRDLETLEEEQLTADGEAFYAYSVYPSATGSPTTRPEAIWSPDSRRVFTAQVDDRQVLDMPVINFAPEDGSVRPTAWSVRAALPGDPQVTQFRMVVIDTETKKQVAAHYPTLPATRMNDTPFGGNRAWWSADGSRAYFVEIERGEKQVNVVEFDVRTGNTRTLFSETSATYVDLASSVYGPTYIVPLPETNEVVWYSERSGWGHLYLYSLTDGTLVRQLTSGSWLVRDVIGVDRARRDLYVTTAGNNPSKDPYYREVARIGIDRGTLDFLSRSDADHVVQRQPGYGLSSGVTPAGPAGASGLSPGGDYYVETIQRPDRPSRSLVRDRTGREILVIENGEPAHAPEWWRWPEPVQLTAADGVTRISGVVFRPSEFSPSTAYPIIDHIYGGPQVSNVPESFDDASYNMAATIAELGFIVVVIDGRGTAERSKAFHDESFGALHTASNVEDHVAGIRQLASRYPYIDTTRVGIYGFSGGGYMTANAMFRFPDFFDVGVSGSGNHDQRLFWHTWGERYQGLVDGDNYLNQANVSYVENFKGKMLFIHGLVDHGVHPGGLFQLTQALMEANKNFDLVLLPRTGHELPAYGLRRMLDYFVENLAGGQPPANFVIKTRYELLRERG